VEYDIFFNGHRKKPPDDLKMRVEKLTRKLAEINMTFSQRFRYTTLVGRFYVYRDHWRRTQQAREQGLELRGAATQSESGSEDAKSADAGGIQVTLTDPVAEESKVKQLYEWLRTTRDKDSRLAPEISYPQFARYIHAQTQGIKQKLGCTSVIFRVSLEEDAIKFTARGNNS
jgi:hypothetical protein